VRLADAKSRAATAATPVSASIPSSKTSNATRTSTSVKPPRMPQDTRGLQPSGTEFARAELFQPVLLDLVQEGAMRELQQTGCAGAIPRRLSQGTLDQRTFERLCAALH
jgi:hypothetical protein